MKKLTKSSRFPAVVSELLVEIPSSSFIAPTQIEVAAAMGTVTSNLSNKSSAVPGENYAQKLEIATGMKVLGSGLILASKSVDFVKPENNALSEMNTEQLLGVIARATDLLSRRVL